MSKSNKFYSPLRYPGGKTAIAPLVKQVLRGNKLIDTEYLEIYAGGAGIALSLLFENFVSFITINDYDRSIYAFWHNAVHENNTFQKTIEQMPINIETWYTQKEIQKNKATADLFELGVSTFFLNRTNVSGVIKGGVIGGKKQNGKYKLFSRFNKDLLLRRIANIGEYKDRIEITNRNAIELLNSNLKNKFVYLDPPYVNKGKNLYMNYYNKNDHQEIANRLLRKKTDFKWMLSYDKNPLIEGLYGSCKNKLSFSKIYGTSKKNMNELIFFHPELAIEDVMDVGLKNLQYV